MGFETILEAYDRYYFIFDGFYYFSQAVFGFEILIRLLAFAPRVGDFFKSFWNRFDFVIVALSFLPAVGPFVVIGRLLRLLRLLRVLSVSDRLRGFVDRLGAAVDEAFAAGFVISVWSYIFILTGNYLFSDWAPQHWGSFSQSLKSVFYLLLLQDVPSLLEPLYTHSKFAIAYFIFFYLVFGTIVLGTIQAVVGQRRGSSRD
jgi:voltage-gated sodium channel